MPAAFEDLTDFGNFLIGQALYPGADGLQINHH